MANKPNYFKQNLEQTNKRLFLPSVIFSIEKEVRANDSHANCHNGKDQEYQQHETIHVVNLVSPERGKNKIHLNENRTKR